MAAKVICRAYGSGSFFGLEFTETEVDGLLIGVARTDDPELLAKFDAHPAFEVVRSESAKPKPKPEAKPKKGR